ncbi:MAG TPA: RHS repeat-associated core domain-containing protein [Planctomycetota bacterium]|nr:RHS repeat-associated core domain-containing protein [Planctomycetota bacterium]
MRTITTTYDGWARPYQVNGPDAYSQSISSFTEADEVWAVATYGPEAGVGGPVMTYQRAHYTYRDQRGRVIVSRVSGEAVGASQTEATSVTTRTWYDRSGRAISSQDGNNVTVGYEYDNGGRLQYVRDAYNVIVEERIYGDDGLLTETKVCNPASKGTDRITARKRAYTSRKELWKDLNANDIGMTYRYGRIPVQIDSVIDPAGAITKTTYHSSTQRVDEVIEAYQSGVARTTKMNWTDGLPTQTLVYNPASGQNNASHARILDQAGRLQVLDAPQGGDLVLTYNEFGDVVGESEGNRSATHVPDGRGFPTSSTVTVGSVNTSISRFFNGSGIQTSVTAQGLTVWQSLAQPEYPGAGNAAWKGTPFRENFVVGETPWKSQSFTHLADGSPETMADAEVPIDNGVQPANHTWSRDSNGRVNQLRFNGTLVMSVQYTPGGMVDFRQIYNASGALVSRTTYAHDSLGRMVSSQTARTSNNKVLCHVVLEYDSSDRITAKELRHLGVRQEFLYNFRGELTNDMSDGNSSWGGASAGGLHGSGFTNLIGPPGTGNESDPSEVGQVESESGSVLVSAMSVPAWDREYTYDPGGNRTTAVIDGVTTTYTYDSGSRLTQSVTGTKTIAYDYDSVGNLVEKTTTQSGQATIVEEYTYDYMNRMDSYANSVTGASWTYQHWPTGDRYSKRNMDSEAATLFVPRWGDVSTEYGQADLEAEPAFENRYVQGLEIDSKTTRIPASGGRRHYVGDQVGTMLVTLTDDGGREEQCVKDAWGMTIAGDTNDERYGFAQRENDTESGLVHMRHRMYDPKSGRFTQIDPILRLRPTEHYRYAANNPITMNDPMGTNPAIALAVWRAAQEMRRREAQQEAMAVWKERVFGVRRDIGPRQLFPNGLPQIVRIRRSDTALEELLGAREMVDEVEALAYHLASNGASDAEVYTLSFSFGVAKASGVEGVQQFADGRDYGKSLVLDRDVRLNSGERCLAGGTGALQLALPAVRGVTWWRSRAPLSFTANEMIPTDLMSKTQFDKLVKSIRANGLKDPNISYVLIEGEPYVVLGSNRLVACRKLGKTGELVFKEVSLPFKDYKTVDDVVRSAADTAAELAERFFR